ncbi:c-type cytochrome [Spectribacter hydrogenooxidans]|uniref:C-type cytochrome n=1 Tax=Spectribacter hydrogenoxidans TaxID=3075608 RepID=A0ABU3BW83_9GAMM|nr:c-type cytochrome [Salinisphaera sp. W335]MDT0633552.1 c-type cytochrome [Salinisphaera sp. W335]
MSMRMLIASGLVMTASMVHADPFVDGDPEAGAEKAAPCAACHGGDGNSSNAQWPKIAGQSSAYLYQQLKHFKSGDRANAVMQGQVANLSDQDMKDLATHYAGNSMTPGVADPEQVDRGSKLYHAGDEEAGVPACAGCHGPAGQGNAAAAYPRIAGQHADYLSTRLKAYREGEQGYPAAAIMSGVAAELADEDIQALTSYIQGLAPRGKASP